MFATFNGIISENLPVVNQRTTLILENARLTIIVLIFEAHAMTSFPSHWTHLPFVLFLYSRKTAFRVTCRAGAELDKEFYGQED